MTFEGGAHLPERSEFLDGEETGLREHGVEAGSAVTLREYEAVALGIVRLGWVVAQNTAEIEDGEQLDL
jgi:hypothetical protein